MYASTMALVCHNRATGSNNGRYPIEHLSGRTEDCLNPLISACDLCSSDQFIYRSIQM